MASRCRRQRHRHRSLLRAQHRERDFDRDHYTGESPLTFAYELGGKFYLRSSFVARTFGVEESRETEKELRETSLYYFSSLMYTITNAED